MSKHNKKYRQLFTTAQDLFWKYGIKRVTIEEICLEANVSKMTFYKYFSNKPELIKHILDHIYDDAMRKYRHIMAGNRSYKEKVEQLFLLKLEATDNISHEFLTDFYNTADEELRGFLNKKVEENLAIMLDDFRAAREKGDIRRDVKPEFITYFLNQMVTMGKDPILNAMYPSAQEMIMELMNFFFFGIMPKNE